MHANKVIRHEENEGTVWKPSYRCCIMRKVVRQEVTAKRRFKKPSILALHRYNRNHCFCICISCYRTIPHGRRKGYHSKLARMVSLITVSIVAKTNDMKDTPAIQQSVEKVYCLLSETVPFRLKTVQWDGYRESGRYGFCRSEKSI